MDAAELRQNPNVVSFKAAAHRFCLLLEFDPADREEWVRQVLVALAELYAGAHHLPTGEDLPDFEDDVPGEFSVEDDEYYPIVRRVNGLIQKNSYWAYFDPTEPPDSSEKPVLGDLGDDLGDIYRDIKPGLRAWETGRDNYLTALVFDWRTPNFESHWGVHAVDAMRALHQIVYP
jgi:hypothetical protein